MRGWLSGIAELLAPRRCVACDEPRHVGADAFCVVCEVGVERLSLGPAALAYGGPVARAVQRFKYEGHSELGRELGLLMVPHASTMVRTGDSIIPVPLHWRRRRKRGYDQAALLAQPLARALGLPLELQALRRVRHTSRQAELPRAARARNVRGAFAADPRRTPKRVLLVDDVRTTGATLSAARHALHHAGANHVSTLALAARVLA